MVRFLDFYGTLALASAATGRFFVFGEHEAPILIERLKAKKQLRAVLFETTLSFDACLMALSYDIPVFFPISLEELYRMLINAPATAVIYVCREVQRMREAYETSGFLSAGGLRQIPKAIREAVKGGDVELALEMYRRMEESYEPGRVQHSASEGSYRRGRMMRLYKKGNASVCVMVWGYASSMVQYLLSESKNIDTVIISGFSRRVMRELKLLSGGYGQVIWISPYDTICSSMIRDKGMRKITADNIDELHARLLAALPRNLRNELHYPGRPEEWPEHHLPDVPAMEQRMCPGCVYRSRGLDSAHCEKLGIDVYRSGTCTGSAEKACGGAALTGKKGNIIGRQDESCVKARDSVYSIKRFLCDGCGICVRECGCPAIVADSLGVIIDPVLCTGCGDCGNVCPSGAIYSYDTRPEKTSK